MHETRWLNAAWGAVGRHRHHLCSGEMGLVSHRRRLVPAGLGVLTVVKGVVVIQVFLEMRHARAVALAVAGVAGVGDRAGSAGPFVGADVRFSDEALPPHRFAGDFGALARSALGGSGLRAPAFRAGVNAAQLRLIVFTGWHASMTDLLSIAPRQG